MPRKKARHDANRSLFRALIVFPRMGIYAIRLSVLWINRSCKPANPAFTMSKEHGSQTRRQSSCGSEIQFCCFPSMRPMPSLRTGTKTGTIRDGRAEPKRAGTARLRPLGFGAAAFSRYRARRLVEPIGIEPTTSSLQSSRSPN